MDNMRTMWRQHGVNMGTTGMCRPHGDNMETTWGQHEDNVETRWAQCGDHREIIQICLKIFDLLRHPHLWVGGWISGSMGG